MSPLKPAETADGLSRMTPFDITDAATWPLVHTADQVAAIYQRPVGGIKKACQLSRFVPAPFQKKPYRWRRADLQRHIDGGHSSASTRWSGRR